MDTGDGYRHGLDVTFSTYVTDYMIAACCILYGVSMFVCGYNVRAKPDKEREKFRNDEECFRDHSDCDLAGKMKEHRTDVRQQAYFVCLAFLTCSGMHSVGGSVHNTVRYLGSNCKVADENDRMQFGGGGSIDAVDVYEYMRLPLLPYFAVWQVGSVFAGTFAFFVFLLISQTLLCVASRMNMFSEEESGKTAQRVARKIRRSDRKILTVLFVSILLLVAYHAWKVGEFAAGSSHTVQFNNSTGNDTLLCGDQIVRMVDEAELEEKLILIWEAQVAILLLAIALFLLAITQTCLLIWQLKDTRCSSTSENENGSYAPDTGSCSPQVFDVSCDALLPDYSVDSSLSSLPGEDDRAEEKRAKDVNRCSSRTQYFQRTFVIQALRCLSAWMLVGSGLTQCVFAASCGTNNRTDCPFPKSFNHNGVYHCFFITAITLLYIAEFRNFSQEAHFLRQKKILLNNNAQ